MNKRIQKIRIHGDNIVECKNALGLIIESFNVPSNRIKFIKSPLYNPIFELEYSKNSLFQVQLFPGYGRWGFDLVNYLNKKGALLRETPDAIITKLISKNGLLFEDPLLSLEFCEALPAGNNAWQRCGRALALAYSEIPYLYYAKIGGVELDKNRNIKAPRFPNPLVPFAYLVLNKEKNVISLPVFSPSPSIRKNLLAEFKQCFAYNDTFDLIRDIILEAGSKNIQILETKAKKIVQMLSKKRKRNDTLDDTEWDRVYLKSSGKQRADWFINKKMPWNKKIGIKKLTPSFTKLISITKKAEAVAIGSKEMPMCLIGKNERRKFSSYIKKLYKERISTDFINWLLGNNKPLLLVWIAGFKPRGDDSRPDRGLVPLARMIFGQKDVDILTIVYGPAKPDTWKRLDENMSELARTNGLWEAIIGLSNAILADSPTNKTNKLGFLIEQSERQKKVEFLPAALNKPSFGEHDIDSIMHLFFSNRLVNGIYESMCNPPGGDWSGLSIIDFDTQKEYRWTSLPRVSGDDSKRPDHVIQFKFNNSILSIESKDSATRLENNIGPYLKKYIKELIHEHNPISFKNSSKSNWQLFSKKALKNNFKIYSGIAFKFTTEEDLKKIKKRSKADLIFGIEFDTIHEVTIIHILISEEVENFLPKIKKLGSYFGSSLRIKIH